MLRTLQNPLFSGYNFCFLNPANKTKENIYTYIYIHIYLSIYIYIYIYIYMLPRYSVLNKLFSLLRLSTITDIDIIDTRAGTDLVAC